MSKEKEIEERVKLAELMDEASLLQEKQILQNEAAVMETEVRNGAGQG